MKVDAACTYGREKLQATRTSGNGYRRRSSEGLAQGNDMNKEVDWCRVVTHGLQDRMSGCNEQQEDETKSNWGTQIRERKRKEDTTKRQNRKQTTD